MTANLTPDNAHTFPVEVTKTYGTSDKHGMTDSREWKTWKSMLERCYAKSHKSYKAYGGRGILVCLRWHRFSNFYSDMGDRPALMTIGRIENDEGYFPGNCRWETLKQNANNRRSSAFIQLNGETKTIAQWADITGIPVATLAKRKGKLGWDESSILTRKPRPQKNSTSRIARSSLAENHAQIASILFSSGAIGVSQFLESAYLSVPSILCKLRKRGFVILRESNIGRDSATGRIHPEHKFRLIAYPANLISQRELEAFQ